MKTQIIKVKSEFDGLELYTLVCEPDGEAKGIIQILHGMCEYKERYEPLMEYFAERGYIVACHDQRGHGDSVRAQEDIGYFYDKTGEGIVEDAVQITRELKARYPQLPIVLYGHSMGSMVARCYLQKYDTLVDKAVISGSPQFNPLVDVAIGLTKLIGLIKGDRHRSPMLTYVTTGRGNNRFKSEGKGAWLSDNREEVEAFYKNPKNRRFTCNGFLNLFKLMKHTYTCKAYQTQAPQMEIFFVSGSDDPVLGGKKQWDKTLAFMRKAGYEKVDGVLYEGMRHEVHNDLNRERALEDILRFIGA